MLRKRARNELLPFGKAVFPAYIPARHLRTLGAYLEDVEAGRINRLIITMPPRHGKSYTTSEIFPAWYLSRNPDKRIILASYAANLSQKFSRTVRNLFDLPSYKAVFPVSLLAKDSRSSAAWDIAGRNGGMISAGVGGGITGHGADLLIIDDPIKDAQEASSQLIRDRLWDWFTTTAYTRLHPGGAAMVIATRWHEDDLTGRLIAQTGEDAEQWTILHFPAIWESGNEKFYQEWRERGHIVIGATGMKEGQALWPARYPVERFRKIRVTVGTLTWFCLYQGTPIAAEGTMFKRAWFKLVDASPREGSRVRYWDKAGTEDGGAYTVGVLMLMARNGMIYVEDVVRGQWSEFERENTIYQTAVLDRQRFGHVDIWVEQEGGSGGKDAAAATIRRLVGFTVKKDLPSGDKVVRAKPFASQAEAGNVHIVNGLWVPQYLDELAAFPNGKYKDQVDGSSGALSKLANVSKASMSRYT